MPPERNGDEPQANVTLAPNTTALTIIAVVAATYLLHLAQPVLIPIVVAILIAFALTPLVNLLGRILFRTLASALAIALFAGAIGLAVWAVTDDAIQVVQSMPEAARRVRGLMREQRRAPDGALKQMQQAATEIERTANEAAPQTARAAGDVQRVQIVEPAFEVSNYLWWGGMGAVGAVSQLAVVLFLAYFLLASDDLYKRKMVKIAGPTMAKRRVTVQIIDEISSQIARFMLTLLGTSLIVATATAVALWWLGLEAWLFWGMVAGILNTIPYFGPVIVSTALTVVGFIQFGNLPQTLAVTGTAFVITSLEGWLITPSLMGRAASMNPAAVFVGLLFWGWVWGMWGVILAVPMMMLIKSICDHVEDLNGLGELLAD